MTVQSKIPRVHRRALQVCFVAICTMSCAVVHGNELEFYRQRIEPILKRHCYDCHSAAAEQLEGSLRLDGRNLMIAGGDTGPAIVPGNAEASLLMKALRHDDLEMPPDGQLPEQVIADFATWIQAGAHAPLQEVSASLREPDYAEARRFWAFRAIQAPSLPAVADRSWPRSRVDYFVLHELERRDLSPAPTASRATLIRRVYFDVLGLPPTPEQVRQFVASTDPNAYQHLVDSLLASPRFGERWAQHWLDVVRYAESEGFEYDRALPGAWRFRDYVIQACNADKPYDQFVTEQLAGDELDPHDPTLRIAAGFHRLGSVRRNAGNQKVASSRNEVLTERTDIVGTAFLALTIGCARCHDHKFDPIPQQDYYRFQAYFAATEEENIPLATDSQQQAWQDTTDRITARIKALKKDLARQDGESATQIQNQIAKLDAQLPPPLPTICSITNDTSSATPIHLLRRGNPDLPGVQVGPRPLGVLHHDERREAAPDLRQPRTELANWLTDVNHPLTARVFANRIWQHYFGRGLVATANDFGSNGDRPSHPELLDDLATMLQDHEWHPKTIHRSILLSSTYRQAALTPPPSRPSEVDPSNRFLWQHARRRLSSEEIRDAILSATGMLNQKAGGPGVMLAVDDELVNQLYKPEQWQVTSDPTEHYRRSIYLVAKRNLRLPFMEVFDQPTAQTSCAARQQSTHAPQALELLNGSLTNELAAAFANRLRSESSSVDRQIAQAFQLIACRLPTAEERRLAARFVSTVSLEEFCLATFNLNAFLYLN